MPRKSKEELKNEELLNEKKLTTAKASKVKANVAEKKTSSTKSSSRKKVDNEILDSDNNSKTKSKKVEISKEFKPVEKKSTVQKIADLFRRTRQKKITKKSSVQVEEAIEPKEEKIVEKASTKKSKTSKKVAEITPEPKVEEVKPTTSKSTSTTKKSTAKKSTTKKSTASTKPKSARVTNDIVDLAKSLSESSRKKAGAKKKTSETSKKKSLSTSKKTSTLTKKSVKVEDSIQKEETLLNSNQEIKETTIIDSTPVIEENAVLDTTPAVEENAVLDTTPVVEENDALDSTPVLEEDTVLDTTSETEDLSTLKEETEENKKELIDVVKPKAIVRKNSTTKAIKDEEKPSKTLRTLKNSYKKLNGKFNKVIELPFVVEYYDLPYKYNKTVIKALAQNPNTLFVYWEISDDDINNLREQYGENFFNETKPVLIIHNLTGKYSFEIEVNDFANNWYIHVNDTKAQYVIELGRRPKEGYNNNLQDNYLYITSSNTIESPNDHVLFYDSSKYQEVLFKNIKTNQYTKKVINPFLKHIYGIYGTLHLDKANTSFDFKNPSSQNPTSNVF